MKAKITLVGPVDVLNSVIINVDDELDPRISKAVTDMAKSSTLAIGDTITITEVE